MNRTLLGLLLLPLPLAACEMSREIVVPAKDVTTRMVLVEPPKALDLLANDGEMTIAPENAAYERALQGLCKGPQEFSAGGAFLAAAVWLGKQGISFLVDKADEALQAELAKYTAAYNGAARGNLYEPVPTGGPVLKYSCFRLTGRYIENGKAYAAMDFVGRLHLAEGSALTVTPLRLYYAKSQAQTDGSKELGVSLSLKADAYWREYNKGEMRAGAFDATILKDKVVLKDGNPFYKPYFKLDAEWAVDRSSLAPREVIGPLPPYSIDVGLPFGSNQTVMTATVVEAGKAPALLKWSAKLFHDNKDKIEGKLGEAVDQFVTVAAP